jgi:four helix bundle protein
MDSNKIRSFRDLIVWQESHKLVLLVYEITKVFPKDEIFGLVSQMRRAAVSISSNIAEGFARNSKLEKIQFYSTAKGSLTELENQLLISKDINYLSTERYEKADGQITSVHKLINASIKSVRDNNISASKYQIPNTKYQSGQSLIETIVAIYILTMALTTALGVVVYSLSRSAVSQNEIVATNLAREGIDVVKAMRDSNWLAGDDKGGQWALQACSDISDRLCFPKTYGKVPGYNKYDLNNPGNYRLEFKPAGETWELKNDASYDLYLQANGTYDKTPSAIPAKYARMINISFNFGGGFAADNSNSNGEMVIKSVVAWRDKNCPTFLTSDDLLALSSGCKVVNESHLTNWKDYK